MRTSVAILFALLLASGVGGDPPAGDHRATGSERPPDCPGRQGLPTTRPVAHGPSIAHRTPTPVWTKIGPYGFVWGYRARPPVARAHAAPIAGYRARLFHMTECPQVPVGDRFAGLDHLITLMGHEGVKFYRAVATSIDAGPGGIIASDDVVVIKINYQWPDRGGTNTDLLRGLIRRIVDHPETFIGEVVVCENSQFAGVQGFDRSANNAEDISLSPHDVVVEFQSQGFDVSHFDWTAIRNTAVAEYSEDDLTDGYVLYPYDAQLNGRVSYPKFRTGSGTHVSLRYGIYDAESGTYDRSGLKFINVPVLMSHHAVYGVTACVKDYMGVVSSSLETNSHNATANGILGAVLGEIQLADLNILDCIWINANPLSGPWTTYAGATRRDELVAGTDPVAIDCWATANILIPAFIANGHLPPWPAPSADPDDPDSAFRRYIDNSMDYILAAGYSVTNDPDQIDVITWSGAGDLDGDGEPDATDNCPYDVNPQQGDCDEDGIGDACAIHDGTSEDRNGNGIPDDCECLADLDGDVTIGFTDLVMLLGTWGPCDGCAADLDGNGSVGFTDLVSLLAAWGPCPTSG